MVEGSLLSNRIKAATKMALAMVLAYGVALSMNWSNPYWAGFAVAFCSLSTVGESLNKGVLRLSGTLLGGLAALTLVALFPQDRWSFLAGMSVFVGLCTFMMSSTSRWYFWYVAGLSLPLLALAGGVNAPNDFQTVILRIEETTLGILSYSVVWLLIWPTSTRETFESTVRRLVAVHRQLTAHYLASTAGEQHDAETKTLRREATQAVSRLDGLLDGAEIDSYETWEARHAWRRSIRLLSQLTDTLERWRQSFPEVRQCDGRRLLPELPRLAAELDCRLADIEGMLDGHPSARVPASVALNVDEPGVASLPPFHRAALLIYRTHLQTIETLTCDLFRTTASARNFIRTKIPPIHDTSPLLPSVLDPERLASMARWLIGLWLALFISLYMPDVPNTVTVIVLTNSILMALCVMPQVPITAVFLPYAFGFALGSAVNVLVMPHLTSFTSLSAVIFVSVFVICFLFHRPTQILGRTAALGLFVMQMAATNEQTYDFLDLTNLAVASVLIFSVVAITTHFPVSFRPEHVFLRLLGRFLGACAYFSSTLEWDSIEPPTRWHRLRRTLRLRDLAQAPHKLDIWKSALRRSTTEEVQRFIDCLYALTYRMQDLMEARATQQSRRLAPELSSEARMWRSGLQEVLCSIARRPDAADFADLRAQLNAAMEHVDGQVEKAAADADQTGTSTRESENSFRLLGTFRGVSEAVVNFAEQAEHIDWVDLREDRF